MNSLTIIKKIAGLLRRAKQHKSVERPRFKVGPPVKMGKSATITWEKDGHQDRGGQ
jgi:hypothetical protein